MHILVNVCKIVQQEDGFKVKTSRPVMALIFMDEGTSHHMTKLQVLEPRTRDVRLRVLRSN